MPYRNSRADTTQQRRTPDDEEQTELRPKVLVPVGVCGGLLVNIRQRIRVDARRDGAQVRDGIHNGDGEHESVQEAQAELQANSLRKVFLGVRQLFSQMSDCIWSTDGEGPVEDTAQERYPRRPPRGVVLIKGTPDRVITRVAGRHGDDDDDGDDAAHDDKEHAGGLGVGDDAVDEDDDEDAEPADKHISDVDVPRGRDVRVLVVDEVQVDRDVGGDLDQRGEVKHPAVEVDPAREEAHYATPFGAGGYRRPVIDTSGRGH